MEQKATRGTLNPHTYEVLIQNEIKEWLYETPFSDFYNEIEKRIIGQEALKTVCANVYNYLTRIVKQAPVKNNMILSAPSGSGKTETYRALRSYFSDMIPDLYIYIYDISAITSAGFRGQDATSILEPFQYNHIAHPVGIVFLDEFDKKMMPSYTSEGTNVNRDVQSNLLTIIEGSNVQTNRGTVDTTRLMFVGLGSFEQFRESRDEEPRQIGLNVDWVEKDVQHFKPLTRDDMVDSGASNEIMGRFPYIVNYDPLSESSVERIIQKSANEALKEFDLKDLSLGDAIVDSLKESANSKYGCRLIESKLRELILDAYTNALFDAPKDGTLSISIEDENHVTTKWHKNKHKEPVYEYDLTSSELADTDLIWDCSTSENLV